MKAERKSLALPQARPFQREQLHEGRSVYTFILPSQGGFYQVTNFMMVLGCVSLYLIAGFIVLFISAKLEQAEVKIFRRGF